MQKKSVRDVDVKGKHVFCRVDFNVPMENGQISDDTRIRLSLPTIQYLVDQGAKVILASHLGRPKGQVQEPFRLDTVAQRVGELLQQPIGKVDQVLGDAVLKQVQELKNGEALLLENIRFSPEEEKNDPLFAQSLAQMADLYVNDAFGTAHRAHASTVGIGEYIPAVSGLLMERELAVFSEILTQPKRPMTAIIGGAKVSDKIGVIDNLLGLVDHLIIGGGLAYTFLRAKGHEIGNSLLEEDKIELAARFIQNAEDRGVQLLLPEDVVVADRFAQDAEAQVVSAEAIPANALGLDIGPKTRASFSSIIKGSQLVVWNGPMGVFEFPRFAEGTFAVAKAVASSSAYSVVGGGDSIAAIEKSGLADQIDHISTGGGASLELLEGKELPGIRVLENRE